MPGTQEKCGRDLSKIPATLSKAGVDIGSADASDLGFPPGGTPEKFDVVSDRTGRPELFTLSETIRGEEGEVSGWKFLSGWGRSSVTVWND